MHESGAVVSTAFLVPACDVPAIPADAVSNDECSHRAWLSEIRNESRESGPFGGQHSAATRRRGAEMKVRPVFKQLGDEVIASAETARERRCSIDRATPVGVSVHAAVMMNMRSTVVKHESIVIRRSPT